MIKIQWPAKYLDLLDKLSFVNIDMVSLLGLKCLKGEYFDFRGRLLIACCVPIVILAIGAIIYFSRLSHLKKKSKPGSQALKDMTMHSIEYIWDMFDLDMSGELNEEEFHHLLVQLNHNSPDYWVLCVVYVLITIIKMLLIIAKNVPTIPFD